MWSVEDVFAEIDAQAPQFGINPAHAKALMLAENTADGKYRPGQKIKGDAVSPMGAQGIMQVMPGTAAGLQKVGLLPPDWKYDPADMRGQVRAGLAAMSDVSGRAKNPADPYELAAGYNGSPAVHMNFNSGNFAALPTETRNYFTKVRTALMDLDQQAPTNLGAPVTEKAAPGTSSGSSKTAAVHTTQRVADPAIMGQLLVDGFSLVKEGGTYDQIQSGIEENFQTRNNLMPALFGAIVQKGQAAGQAAAAEATVDAAEAAKRALILVSTNLDPTVANNLMDQSVKTINETDLQLRQMKPEIDAKMAVGFFDNPLEWLVNQTRLPGMVASYNAVATTQNAAIDKFKSIATIAGTQQSLAKGVEADLIARKGTAKAAEAAAIANAELARAQIEATTANSRDYLTLAHIASERIGVDMKLFNATAVNKAETAGMTEKQKAEAAEKETLDNVNRLITAAGGNGISLQQFKMMGSKEKEELVQLASTGKFGKDFAQSFSFQDSVGNRRELARKGGLTSVMWMDTTQADAMKFAKDELAKWEKMNPGKLPTSKQKEEVMLGALNQMQARYEYENKNDMRKASEGNPYKLAYAAWAKDPRMANNPMAIFINTYGPEGKEPVFTSIDEKYILDRFTTSVQRGTMSAGDAAKAISDFYKFSIQGQAITTAYPLYGLIPATTYNIEIPTSGIMSGRGAIQLPGKVNLADPKSVENYLTKNTASKITQENISKQGGLPPVDFLGINQSVVRNNP